MKVNEESGVTFTIAPTDEDGKARTPTNTRYRLDDKVSATNIIAWTTVVTPSTEMTIQIPSSSNAMIDPNVAEEVKVLTVETDYSTDSAHKEEHEYTVLNLQFIS